MYNFHRRQQDKISLLVLAALLTSVCVPFCAAAETHHFVYDDYEDLSLDGPVRSFDGSARSFVEPARSTAQHVDKYIPPSERTRSQKFIDKWILNGAALGSAIGSLVGVFVFQTFIPGPVGLILGTLVGGTIGSLIGSYIDDRKGEAINYSSFERPPVTKGGMWLKDVGPWEQFMYQIDAWVINGGGLAANISHIGLSLLARAVPGIGAWLSPVMIAVSDYVAAVIGDNIDGTVDLGNIGRKWDGAAEGTSVTDAAAQRNAGPRFSNIDVNQPRASQQYRDDYRNLVSQLGHGERQAQEAAYLAYRNSSTAMHRSRYGK